MMHSEPALKTKLVLSFLGKKKKTNEKLRAQHLILDNSLLLQQFIYANEQRHLHEMLHCKNTMCQYFKIHWKNYLRKMKCGKCFRLEWKYFPTDGLVCHHVCTCNFCLIRRAMLWEPLLFSWSCDYFQQTSVNKTSNHFSSEFIAV